MEIRKTEWGAELHGCADFVPEKIFGCGQCFRWDTDGVGIARGHIARVVKQGDVVRIECAPELWEPFWVDYFDLRRDYQAIRETLSRDPHMVAAAAFGAGIRILRQEPWEALVSFLISQCNHIPRIRGIIEIMCRMFGDEVELCGVKRFSFPDPERIAACTLEELAPLRAGYRTKYILKAARQAADGELDLDAVSKLPTDEARRVLLTLDGVGNKVADCVLLFGMGKWDACPMDVWMKRAVEKFYQGKAPDFGDIAGLAQQYLFHYIRNGGEKQETE